MVPCIERTASSLTELTKAAFLSALFLTGLGMVLYNNSIVIHIISEENDSDDGEDVSIPAWFSLEVAGAVIAILFWVSVLLINLLYQVSDIHCLLLLFCIV